MVTTTAPPHAATLLKLNALRILLAEHRAEIPEQLAIDVHAGQVEIGVPMTAGSLADRHRVVDVIDQALHLPPPQVHGRRYETSGRGWHVYTPEAGR